MNPVDDYIEALPDDRRILCEKIRELILSLVPEIDERLSFKIPFYHYFGMFMYFNNTKEGIAVCFLRGKDLLELFPQLQLKQRAITASVLITSLKEIQCLQLQEIILTAAAWNQEASTLNLPVIKAGRKQQKNPGKASARKHKRKI